MRKPTLSELAQWSEVVAAIAVVVSLVYVGKGLQENTIAVKAASVQSINDGTREALMDLATSAELSQIVATGTVDRSALDDLEKARFHSYSRQRWLFFQTVWLQNELGVFDTRSWQAYARIACETISTPGNRDEWPHHVDALDPGFVEFVESCGTG